MKRKDFLRGFGIAGVGSILPKPSFSTPVRIPGPLPPNCVLIPSETAGPFPLDLTENQFYFRQDVREDRAGVRLNLKMKIIGLENCLPMPNVRVNIWHCDKDGNYSGYGNQSGLTYLRGYQLADANGEVNFITIFPGWYPGRTCHIHFQVYVSSVYAAISQLTFPHAAKNIIYTENPSIYTDGVDPVSPNQDGIFSDGYTYQLATLTQDPVTGDYDSYLEVTIQGTGTTALKEAEPETGGQFKLGQNQPNPYLDKTIVPFEMKFPGNAFLEIWDLSGKKRVELSKAGLASGHYSFEIKPKNLGLPNAVYVYQLRVENSNGVFRQAKVMTSL
jgi:hypothetical protein